MIDLQNKKEIELIVSDVLEAKNRKLQLFGSSQESVGSDSADLVLRTKGKVKIKTGSKFIDIIKDGKLNVASSEFIFLVNSKDNINKDGVYIVPNEDSYSIYACIDKQTYLVHDNQAVFVSFEEEQNKNAELKLQALLNIGFFYNTLEEAKEAQIKDGIIYILSSGELYTVNNSVFKAFTADSSNQLTTGSLTITDTAFTTANSYSFVIGGDSVFILNSENKTAELLYTLIVDNLHSKNNEYIMETVDGKSTLTVDKLIVRDEIVQKEEDSGEIQVGSVLSIQDYRNSFILLDPDKTYVISDYRDPWSSTIIQIENVSPIDPHYFEGIYDNYLVTWHDPLDSNGNYIYPYGIITYCEHRVTKNAANYNYPNAGTTDPVFPEGSENNIIYLEGDYLNRTGIYAKVTGSDLAKGGAILRVSSKTKNCTFLKANHTAKLDPNIELNYVTVLDAITGDCAKLSDATGDLVDNIPDTCSYDSDKNYLKSLSALSVKQMNITDPKKAQEYPIVWTDEANNKDVSKDLLKKTYEKFTYEPLTSTLFLRDSVKTATNADPNHIELSPAKLLVKAKATRTTSTGTYSNSYLSISSEILRVDNNNVNTLKDYKTALLHTDYLQFQYAASSGDGTGNATIYYDDYWNLKVEPNNDNKDSKLVVSLGNPKGTVTPSNLLEIENNNVKVNKGHLSLGDSLFDEFPTLKVVRQTGTLAITDEVFVCAEWSDMNKYEDLEDRGGIAPKVFNWKTSDGRDHIGFDALSVEKFYPELVITVDGKKYINYMGYCAVLLTQINSLKATIDDLNTTLEDNKTALATLLDVTSALKTSVTTLQLTVATQQTEINNLKSQIP